MIIWKQNFVSSILMFKQTGLPSMQSSDFVNHLNDYTLNWTPPSRPPARELHSVQLPYDYISLLLLLFFFSET